MMTVQIVYLHFMEKNCMLQIDIFLNTKILKTKTDHKSTEIISILIQNFPKK